MCLVGGLFLLYWQHDVTNKDQALSIALGLYMAGKGLFLLGIAGCAGDGKNVV